MLNTVSLLDRLDKISHKMPTYYLSYHDSASTHRQNYSLTTHENLKLNLKRIMKQKSKNTNPSSNFRLRSTLCTPRKHHG